MQSAERTLPHLKVRRLSYALGAAVTGVDLRRDLDAQTVAALRQVWLDHGLLCLPDQDIARDDFVRFVKYFGEPMDYAQEKTPDPENSTIFLLTNQPIQGRPWDGYKEGQTWHSDMSYAVHPNTGTFALAKMMPKVGGDTMFANCYLAFETLSPAMQRMIEGLSAVHETPQIKNFDLQSPEYVAEHRRRWPPVVHPVVKVHPETGRKSIYLGQRVRQIVGMTVEESRPLLDFLNEHAVRYEFIYRHRWRVNDLIVWDNRCLMHRAPFDYDLKNEPRHLWRTSLVGPVCGTFYEPSAPA